MIIKELLDRNRILKDLNPVLQPLVQLEVFDTIDSTQNYLLQQAKVGAPSGTVCFAETQTAGRGRLGKLWSSPYAANLACSLLWRFPVQPRRLPPQRCRLLARP